MVIEPVKLRTFITFHIGTIINSTWQDLEETIYEKIRKENTLDDDIEFVGITYKPQAFNKEESTLSFHVEVEII